MSLQRNLFFSNGILYQSLGYGRTTGEWGFDSRTGQRFSSCAQAVSRVYLASHTTGRLRLKRDGTRAETRLRLSVKRTSPLKSAGASVQSTTGSRGVRISGINAGYTMFRGIVRVLATHPIRQFPLHFPSRASPCAIRFQTHSTSEVLPAGKAVRP
jgi:hypothetical protein